jgi:hypothetical protein
MLRQLQKAGASVGASRQCGLNAAKPRRFGGIFFGRHRDFLTGIRAGAPTWISIGHISQKIVGGRAEAHFASAVLRCGKSTGKIALTLI